MSLSERLQDDMKQAMRSQDKFRLSVIRMVRASIKNAEIEKRAPLDDSSTLEIIQREVKMRRDSLQEFEKAGRQDLVDKIKAEYELLQTYLPRQLNEEEITMLVEDAIQEVGASSKADMGKLMSVLMPKVKGRADGKLVNYIVSQRLS